MTELLFQTLNLSPESTPYDVERAFTPYIKERIQSYPESYNPQKTAEEEAFLKKIFSEYFDVVKKKSVSNIDKKKDPPNIAKLRSEAATYIKGIEQANIAFAVYYMKINHYIVLVRDTIQREEKFMAVSGERVKWTSDMNIMLLRYRKRKRELETMNERLQKAILVFDGTPDLVQVLEQEITNIAGNESGSVLRSITSSIRVKNFERARKSIKNLSEYKKKLMTISKNFDASKQNAVSTARKLLDIVENNMEILEDSEGKLFLRASEINNTLNANNKEIQDIRKYLAKYQMPYMEDKLNNLSTMKDKLLLIGTLDSLITLHMNIIRGMNAPLDTLSSQREFETAVYEKSKFLISVKYPEMKHIEEQSEKIVQEFTNGLKQYLEEKAQAVQEGNISG